MIRRALTLALSSGLLIAVLGAGTALAAPVWNLDIHHGPTNFSDSEQGELWFTIANVGDEPTGPGTLTIALPEGLSRSSVMEEGWSCPGNPGDQVITCTANEGMPRHTVSFGTESGNLTVVVNVAPEAVGKTLLVTGTVAGGGAAPATATEAIKVGGGPAGFGIVPGSFVGDFFKSDESTPVRESGAHPELATFSFDLSNLAAPSELAPNEKLPVQAPRNVEVELPPGFVGNPSAVAECSPAQLIASSFVAPSSCPPSSQVGRIDVGLERIGFFGSSSFIQKNDIAVYNMEHPRGTVTDLAFVIAENVVHIRAKLDPARGYAITAVVPDINQFLAVYFQKLTLWGFPGSSSHDSERCGNVAVTTDECRAESSNRPFLTVPSLCGVPLSTDVTRFESWQAPNVSTPEVRYDMPGQTIGCDRPRFSPRLSAEPSDREAASPTGLEVHLSVPQNENPNGLATPPVKKVRLTLPDGMTLSPSFANGLGACTEGQVGISAGGVPNSEPVQCPNNSRVGAVSIKTPLLDKPLEGSMFLASQGENPFNSTFAVYLVIHDTEERGVLLKIPGKLELNPVTGQITTVFDNLPQFPFEEFDLVLPAGRRAPLINPSTCGQRTVSAEITSYAQPSVPVEVSSGLGVTSGVKGAPCPASGRARGFSPELNSGTVNPEAGAFASFVTSVNREDGDQNLSGVTVETPKGLLADIASVPLCDETDANAGACPESSKIGSLIVAAGAGSEPLYLPQPGKREDSVYLTGPYNGGPFGLSIVTHAEAGPFNLGDVVVRASIRVNPVTAQVTVVSDPLPQIKEGVPFRLRLVNVNIDRPNFIFNPTNCEETHVNSTITGLEGGSFSPSNRFEVANCALLPFKPKLSASTQGKTSKADGASLIVKVSQQPGEANLHKVSLTLPTVLPARLTTLQKACTEAQFAVNPAGCPAGSFVGTGRGVTPVLGVPLTGPAILVSHGGAAFPDVVFLLQANERGGNIRIDLVGHTQIKKGITYSRFETIPDAPITSFEASFPQGLHSVLAATGNLCTSKLAIPTELVGQNGAKLNQTTKLTVTGCPKTKTLTRARKLALALKACHKKHGAKRQACERQARRKYGPVKKAKGR